MITHRVEIQGTLQPDGTLVLDSKPNLPPGRVRVVVEQVEVSSADFMEVLEQIWADQDARGYVPRSHEEIDAELAAMREEDEERMQGFERLHEECQRARSAREPESP